MTTTLLNFFQMNGYGFYIWTAYGGVLVFLLVQWFIPWRRWRRYLSECHRERNCHPDPERNCHPERSEGSP